MKKNKPEKRASPERQHELLFGNKFDLNSVEKHGGSSRETMLGSALQPREAFKVILEKKSTDLIMEELKFFFKNIKQDTSDKHIKKTFSLEFITLIKLCQRLKETYSKFKNNLTQIESKMSADKNTSKKAYFQSLNKMTLLEDFLTENLSKILVCSKVTITTLSKLVSKKEQFNKHYEHSELPIFPIEEQEIIDEIFKILSMFNADIESNNAETKFIELLNKQSNEIKELKSKIKERDKEKDNEIKQLKEKLEELLKEHNMQKKLAEIEQNQGPEKSSLAILVESEKLKSALQKKNEKIEELKKQLQLEKDVNSQLQKLCEIANENAVDHNLSESLIEPEKNILIYSGVFGNGQMSPGREGKKSPERSPERKKSPENSPGSSPKFGKKSFDFTNKNSNSKFVTLGVKPCLEKNKDDVNKSKSYDSDKSSVQSSTKTKTDISNCTLVKLGKKETDILDEAQLFIYNCRQLPLQAEKLIKKISNAIEDYKKLVELDKNQLNNIAAEDIDNRSNYENAIEKLEKKITIFKRNEDQLKELFPLLKTEEDKYPNEGNKYKNENYENQKWPERQEGTFGFKGNYFKKENPNDKDPYNEFLGNDYYELQS